MHSTRHWTLLSALLFALPTYAESEVENSSLPQPTLQQKATQLMEEIPDDIWSTIASPFDPITTSPGFAPPPRPTVAIPVPAPTPAPQRRVEMMQPQQHIAPPPVPAPTPRTIMAPAPPPIQPQPMVTERVPTPVAPQPRSRRYSPQPVPYELPPQEKVVADYPEEYWNCLLNNLQGVGSDVAAKLITRACQKKYPKQ